LTLRERGVDNRSMQHLPPTLLVARLYVDLMRVFAAGCR
jgi:hypothetical protein